MNIIKLDSQHQQEYENFVAAHTNLGGSFLQSWGWGEFQNQLGKSVVRYGIFDNDTSTNKLIGAVQFVKTKIPHLPGYYLYSPYGPVIKNEQDAQSITDQVVKQIKIDFPDCWFVRLEPKQNLKLIGAATMRTQPGKTLVTDLAKPLDEITAAMHPKTRYNIKVANKHNVIVESEINASPQHGFHIAELLELLTKTSSRQKFRSYGKDYYQKLIDFFVLHTRSNDCKVVLYKALYNKQLVAGAIMVDHGSTRTYLFGGSDDANRNLMAPYAMHWQAMQDAKKDGLTKYDWWGIETAGGQTPGFVQFKLKWGGEQIAYPPATDIVNSNGWYMIYKLLRKLNRLV